jgi:hypothetical protein
MGFIAGALGEPVRVIEYDVDGRIDDFKKVFQAVEECYRRGYKPDLSKPAEELATEIRDRTEVLHDCEWILKMYKRWIFVDVEKGQELVALAEHARLIAASLVDELKLPN